MDTPYTDSSIYETFDAANPPVCSNFKQADGDFKVECEVLEGQILKFIFTEISVQASGL